MKTERRSFADAPDTIGAEGYDCLWVRLDERAVPGPLKSRALQWLDWQMQGKLSELIASHEKRKQTTFFPMMRKFPIPYVAVDVPSSADWEAFLGNCRGMKLKRVLYFCEDGASCADFERELKGHRSEAFPEFVAFGSDHQAGK